MVLKFATTRKRQKMVLLTGNGVLTDLYQDPSCSRIAHLPILRGPTSKPRPHPHYQEVTSAIQMTPTRAQARSRRQAYDSHQAHETPGR